MKALSETVTGVVHAMVDSGKVEEVITRQVESTISSIVKELFRERGDFGKQLKDRIGKAVALDLTEVSIPEYNVVIAEVIKRSTADFMEAEAKKMYLTHLDKILQPAPPEITTQGLLDLYLERWRDDEDPRDLPEVAHVRIERWKYDSAFITLQLWKDDPDGKYSFSSKPDPALNIFIGKDGKIKIVRGESHKNFASSNYGPDAKVYQMYAAGTVITDIHEVDEEDLETYLLDDY